MNPDGMDDRHSGGRPWCGVCGRELPPLGITMTSPHADCQLRRDRIRLEVARRSVLWPPDFEFEFEGVRYSVGGGDAMSERLTKAQLAEIQGQIDLGPYYIARWHVLLALLEDWRRLRGLMVDVEDALWALDGTGAAHQDYDNAMALLRVEARAIRAEESPKEKR
jgi:hypothetical protein